MISASSCVKSTCFSQQDSYKGEGGRCVCVCVCVCVSEREGDGRGRERERERRRREGGRERGIG